MPLRDDLLNPIAGDNPGGVNLRYEPIFDQIKDARREDEGVPEGVGEDERKTADYKLVAKLAGDTLAKKSKDLWLAAWLTEAQLKREGIGGLREGLELIQGMLERFWDHLNPAISDPEDIELRAAPLSWVGQYLVFAVRSAPLNKQGHSFLQCKQAKDVPTEDAAGADKDKKAARDGAVQDGKLTPEEFETGFANTPKPWYKELVANLSGCFAALDALTKFSEEKFAEIDPDQRPAFGPLQGALKEVHGAAQVLLNKKLELDPDPPEPEGELAGGAVGAGEAGQVISIEPNDPLDAAARVAAAARFLRQESPTNPASYLMLRGFRWGELRANGKDLDPRLLVPPPTPVRAKLKGLLLDGKWDQLLAEGEWVMAQAYGRGWLDLQRYILTACDALGSEYNHVAVAIRGALAAMLRDLPELPQLTLMDDTQTANAETKAWLREQLAAEEATGRVAIALPKEDETAVVAAPRKREESPEALFERAMSLMRGGRPEKGIELLMSAADQEKSPRDRFLRRAQAAGIMVDSGHEPIALPILKELVEQIESHKLEEWEAGEIVARPIGLLYRCMNALNTDSDDVRKNLYIRICRLDPIQAMAFNNKQGSGQRDDASPQAAQAASQQPQQPQQPDAQAGT
jgi:type VI secretion system protein ImpA